MRANAVLESIVRKSHCRLLALLASASRDISAAEDALAHSYRSAAESWNHEGVPTNPEGWLVRVAKNFMLDLRRSHFHSRAEPQQQGDDAMELAVEMPGLLDEERPPDRRLELMFAAAHPSLDESIRAPLILQTIVGLEVKEIAPLFSTPVATMAQRLVRAKTKIRDAGIPFSIPERREWPERLEAVLEAIYGAFCAGFDDAFETAEEHRLNDRGLEAMYLADLLTALLPNEPEGLGLAALISFSASRASARTAVGRPFVPLEEQDATLWEDALIQRAASWLERASSFGGFGRFQLEAAIQAVHADRKRTGVTDWQAIAHLYEGLLQVAPTRGVIVARAYVISKVGSLEAAIAALHVLDDEAFESFVPALACRAHLRERKGNLPGAIADLARAVAALPPGPSRTHLDAERSRLAGSLALP
jgi:RNA polymerase sigma-70 factor, ECF subfamily